MSTIRLGRYRHFKGKDYEVIGTAKDTETLNEYVVYKALYGKQELWIRPLTMFLETIERDGKQFQRFKYNEEPS
jgi:cyclomaltodextrinase / maltogenic alpha-amylase / neopullulanase